MIFITVGTHEQPFNRLLKCIDELIENGKINEEIICQKGYSDYEPKNYKAEKLIPYDQMQKNIEKARIVITHGGPASFIAPLSIGKIPIVVPRKKELDEHVNNHQIEFARDVEKIMKNIIVAETDEELEDAIVNYEIKVKKMNCLNNSNNIHFNQKLEEEIRNLYE